MEAPANLNDLVAGGLGLEVSTEREGPPIWSFVQAYEREGNRRPETLQTTRALPYINNFSEAIWQVLSLDKVVAHLLRRWLMRLEQ